ncbi:hypothetical protein BG846_05391 [Streptomyces fradiae ATCC 10745 = DSM 40063]|nr:hypothetical protein BG846_05391 [Streptomyces fradiae ATCC 10745 = DSM 40063]
MCEDGFPGAGLAECGAGAMDLFGGWLPFQEFERPRDESVVVLEDPSVSASG